MRRSDLRQRMQQRPALAKYLAHRQLLQTPTMKAVRFLQTLGLITRHSYSRDRGVRSLLSTLMDHQVSPEMEEPLTFEGDLKPGVSQNASLDIDGSLTYGPIVESEGVVGPSDYSIALGIPPKQTGPRGLERPEALNRSEELNTRPQNQRREDPAATHVLRVPPRVSLEELSRTGIASEYRVEPGVPASELEGEDLPVAEVMERTEETTTETKSPLPLSVKRSTPKPLPQSTAGSQREYRQQTKLESHSDLPREATHDGPAEIFASRESDRSPLAWLARLVEVARPQPDAEPIKESHHIGPPASTLRTAVVPNRLARGSQRRSFRSLAQVEQPQTLSQATRRFIKPLVGIDPANVPVYAGSSAAQLATKNQADALTTSEIVLLGPGHASESPEQLGVLAHELTHVARQRQPRFVPPIARQAPAQSVATVRLETMDEEVLARRVESRVIRAAKATEDRASSPEPVTTSKTESLLTPDELAIAPVPSESSAATPDWGGLPAPWEPLPEWMSTPVGDTVSSAPAAATRSAADISLADTSSSVSPGPVQLAGEGRSLEEDPHSAPAAVHEVQAAESVEQVAPDLDAMAQQVYSILKRRLAAERRRESF